MSFEHPHDEARDGRRLAVGLLLASSFLLLTLMVAGARSLSEGPEIHQLASALGDVDRCITCHALAPGSSEPVAHPPRWKSHLEAKLGCTACHGGVGRALSREAAHASAPDGPRDPLLRLPGLEAACVRCHPPGVPGTEGVARGAQTFLRLGCGVCHPLTEDGRGGESFGPDLRRVERKSTEAVREAILEPTKASPGSTMPPFARSFTEADPALDDLLLFLASLSLAPPTRGDLRPRTAPWVAAPCASCHGGKAGHAAGRRRHACTYLLERGPELRCAGCHPAGIPAPEAKAGLGDAYCPLVKQHRSACVVCHGETPVGWGRR